MYHNYLSSKGIDGPMMLGLPIKVYCKSKEGWRDINGKENSVREQLEGSNWMDNCHQGVGDEDAGDHANEHEHKMNPSGFFIMRYYQETERESWISEMREWLNW